MPMFEKIAKSDYKLKTKMHRLKEMLPNNNIDGKLLGESEIATELPRLMETLSTQAK